MKVFPVRWITIDGSQTKRLNSEWLNAEIEVYAAQRENIYKPFAAFLQDVLGEFCRRYAPQAIVQARPKGMISFSEKAALKAGKYEDEPVYQMTDLCGARVILHTQSEVDSIRRCVRQAFDIDEGNSLDAKSRLKSDQFGYSGFHLIVQVKSDCVDIMGVAVPKALKESVRDNRIQRPRAEIQVRTILEHAWADTFHDRLYKTGIVVPEMYKREAAMLAAIMEDADASTSRLAGSLDAFSGNYAAHLSEDEIRSRIGILKIILDGEKKQESRAEVALRMARMASSLDDQDEVIALLKEFKDIPAPLGHSVRFLYGAALCRKGHEGSAQGRSLLVGVELDADGPAELRGAAAAELAHSWASESGHEANALAWFRKAIGYDPDNPYYLAELLEYEAYVSANPEVPSAMRRMMEKAITVCRDHIRVGLELPRAHATIGRLRLLLGQPEESLCAYAKAVEFCRSHGSCAFAKSVDAETRFLSRLNFGKKLPPDHEMVRRFLLLAKAIYKDESAIAEIKELALRGPAELKLPVLTLVGGAAYMALDGLKSFRDALEGALIDFEGTVIGGGTKSGIPGVLGEIVAGFRAKDACRFDAVAYLPAMIPKDAPPDRLNYQILGTNGQRFSPLEPIQGWVDLVAAGVSPENVRVLGYDGGKIAAVEYRIALALGATVCVVAESGREAAGLLKDEDWKNAANLIPLPASCVEPMSLRALLYPHSTDLNESQLDALGRCIHENFCAKHGKPEFPLSQKPWAELRCDFKKCNIDQAAYARQVLRMGGYEVGPAENPNENIEFPSEAMERMARAEHGRWVIERLSSGWKYGPEADKPNKISPYICGWAELSEDVRKCDRDAVRDFPKVLAKVGLEVYISSASHRRERED